MKWTTLLQAFRQQSLSQRHVQPGQRASIQNSWKSLIRAYRFKTQTSTRSSYRSRRSTYAQDLEQFNKEFDYVNSKDMFKRISFLALALYGFSNTVGVPLTFDWKNYMESRQESLSDEANEVEDE